MKTQTSKICVIFILAVFLLSIIPMTSAKTLKEWDQTAVKKYSNAKAEYLKIKNSYTDARQDWITARDKYKQYKNTENIKDALEKGKDFLLKADKTLVSYLEMIDSYVEGEPSLSETEKEDIHKELTLDISWLEAKQSEIEEASTKKELTDIAKAVKNKWQEIRPTTKKIVGQVMNAKLLLLIENAESASGKIENRISTLQEEGKDTTDLEILLSDFNEKIDLAKQKHQAAKDKYAEIDNIQNADKLAREGNNFIKEANQYIRNAYKDLKEIVKELRST